MNSLLSNLISYFPLHEASGTRYDALGAGNNLTDVNTVTGNPGIIENASQFTRTNSENLTVADNASLSIGDTPFCLAGWLYFDTLVGYMALINKFGSTNAEREYLLAINAGGTALQFYCFNSGGASDTVTSSVALATGTWYFVSIYADSGTSGNMYICVNGTINSASKTKSLQDGTGTFGFTSNSSGFGFFNGRACEWGLWKGRYLTYAEYWWLYNSGRGRTYPFDGRLSPAMQGRRKLPRRNRLTGIAI